MYEDYYGLIEKPFNLTPDPKFLFLSDHQRFRQWFPCPCSYEMVKVVVQSRDPSRIASVLGLEMHRIPSRLAWTLG